MSNRLPIATIVIRALSTPLRLETASWKALVRPLLAVALVCLAALAAHYAIGGPTARMIFLGLLGITILWLAWTYLRHVLLGAAGCESASKLWPRYGPYLLILGIAGVFLAYFMHMLLNLVLPAVMYLQLAMQSPKPLLATGYIMMWIVGIATPAAALVRFVLLFPAVAAGHDVAPGRIWRLARGNSLRLFLLLVVIPGGLLSIGQLSQDAGNASRWGAILAGLLTVGGDMWYLAMLALAYRRLSDIPLPELDRPIKGLGFWRDGRRRWAAITIVLIGLGGIAVWNGLYRIAPGERAQILRFGDHHRIVSEPGTRFKIPLIEDARPIPEVFQAQYTEVFVTADKNRVSLACDAQWRVVDAARFARTTGGRSKQAEMRIGDFLSGTLRERIATMRPDDMRGLMENGGIELRPETASRAESRLDGILTEINARIAVLGIEINSLRIGPASPAG